MADGQLQPGHGISEHIRVLQVHGIHEDRHVVIHLHPDDLDARAGAGGPPAVALRPDRQPFMPFLSHLALHRKGRDQEHGPRIT